MTLPANFEALADRDIYAAYDAARADGNPILAQRIAYQRQDLFDWSGEVPEDFTDDEALACGLA